MKTSSGKNENRDISYANNSYVFLCMEAKCSFPDSRAGAGAVDLGGSSVYQRGQNLKLNTKAAVFKRESLLIEGAKQVDWGGQASLAPPWCRSCQKASELFSI